LIYSAYSLNGAWEMYYTEDKYKGKEVPLRDIEYKESETELEAMNNNIIDCAVPGYWEDMTDKFKNTDFYRNLKINPEYGIQEYPIMGTPPDMALPNIYGNFFYRKIIDIKKIKHPASIHFEGVQNSVSVWINDVFVGQHEGYSTPFEMEIKQCILKEGKNTIVLSVCNHRLQGYAGEPISGLTSRAANECTGGITGNVEIRFYKSPLRDFYVLTSKDCKTVTVKTDMTEKTDFSWTVWDGGNIIRSGRADGDFFFETDGMELWSPEDPRLYTLKLECNNESLSRDFGVRRLLSENKKLSLNGKPYYLRGICEHFYIPETVHPNHDYARYKSIIKSVKKLGFNFIRFHTHIPEEEYMRAADELGMLLHVECPNNTAVLEWNEIVGFCRRHTSVVIYCCGNEMLVDEHFIEYLKECADAVHSGTDSLFSPLSALRGIEYFFTEPEQEKYIIKEPFRHNKRRMEILSGFCDLFSSFPHGVYSYESLKGSVEKANAESECYGRPRLSHEICIDGTYTDLSLKERYKNTRIGNTRMFDSIERHLSRKGLLEKAPVFFKNSSEWQRRIRKYCFEKVRRTDSFSGFDFLGPIDTHWHTFGYDVGMMNEFYELKPGETVRNVLMYNSPTVLLTDLDKCVNFVSEQELMLNIFVSHYGEKPLKNACLEIRLSIDGKVKDRKMITAEKVEIGRVSLICNYAFKLPKTDKAKAMKLYVTLDGGETFAENEWELYIFPNPDETKCDDLIVSNGMTAEELIFAMENGKKVVILGSAPFATLDTTFKIALAGRTAGNLATVIYDHPVTNQFPHDSFCGWQFSELMENGRAVCFETEGVPFDPIIEVASSHKYAIRQAAMFEFEAINGKLLVCSFNFNDADPAACWLKECLLMYANSDEFKPRNKISRDQLYELTLGAVRHATENTNIAFNPNDKTATRKKYVHNA